MIRDVQEDDKIIKIKNINKPTHATPVKFFCLHSFFEGKLERMARSARNLHFVEYILMHSPLSDCDHIRKSL